MRLLRLPMGGEHRFLNMEFLVDAFGDDHLFVMTFSSPTPAKPDRPGGVNSYTVELQGEDARRARAWLNDVYYREGGI